MGDEGLIALPPLIEVPLTGGHWVAAGRYIDMWRVIESFHSEAST